MLELILAIITIILALIPLIFYLISRFYYDPKITIIVSGQQSGTPIPLPSSNDEIRLGVTSARNEDVIINEISIQFKRILLHLKSHRYTLKGRNVIAKKHSVFFRIV